MQPLYNQPQNFLRVHDNTSAHSIAGGERIFGGSDKYFPLELIYFDSIGSRVS